MYDKNIVRSMQMPPIQIQKYERYLPTAFDESLSLLEKINKVILYLQDYGNVTEEMLEKWNEVYRWVSNEGVNETTLSIIRELINDGTIAEIINVELFNKKADQSELDDVTSRLADISLNVTTMGVVGDGVTDDTAAFQNAVNKSLQTGVPLYLPNQSYLITAPIIIEYISGYPQSSIFKIFGNSSGDAVHPKTKIIFRGIDNMVFDVRLNSYAAEGYEFVGFSFVQEDSSPSFQTSEAIVFTKTTTNYPRKFIFSDLNSYGFKTLVKFLGDTTKLTTDNANYFGPIHFEKIHTYLTLKGIEVNNAVLNLLTIEKTLFHGCNNGGGIDTTNGIIYASVSNTHLEGCEPAGIQTGPLRSKITLNGVSSENTGANSGKGLISTGDLSYVELYINNQVYDFVKMPTEYKLSRGVRVWANCNINVSGEGIIINTPETITPVVSNNTTYNQTDVFGLFLTPYTNLGNHYAGVKVFENLGGSNNNTGISPDSSELPDYLKANYVGCKGRIVVNNDESFTAPSDGLLYFTWLGKKDSILNGFNQVDILIDGVIIPIPIGYRWGIWEGFYTLVIPIKIGQVLTQTVISTYSMTYQSVGMVSFSSKYEKASICSNGFPSIISKRVTIPANSVYDLSDLGERSKSFAVSVSLNFNNGLDGFYKFLSRGGGDNLGRVGVDLVSSLSSNITIADDLYPLNANMYRKTITNSSANDINCDVVKEYIS